MVEKQTIDGKEVWLKVDAIPIDRPNQNIIPREYFTASYFFEEPSDSSSGEIIKDEDGEPKMFESPVAALTYAWKNFQKKS